MKSIDIYYFKIIQNKDFKIDDTSAASSKFHGLGPEKIHFSFLYNWLNKHQNRIKKNKMNIEMKKKIHVSFFVQQEKNS